MGAPELLSNQSTVTTEKLMADLRMLITDAEALVSATAGEAGERMVAVRARARDSLARARLQLEQLQQALGEKARTVVSAGRTYTRERPWTALGVAATAGVLIGLLIGRR